jgi:hypothetical protein
MELPGDALLDRVQRLDHIGAKIEIDATGRERELIIDLRSTLNDVHVEAIAFIVAVDERLVKPAVFGLRKPVCRKAYTVESARLRCGADEQKSGKEGASIFHCARSMRRAIIRTSGVGLAAPVSPA